MDQAHLDHYQRAAFDYFMLRANLETGLVPDTSREGAPASIAVVGFALSCYPLAVERKWITRDEAATRTLNTVRFFWNGPKESDFKAIGKRGFCYHFLDMKTGKRAWDCELSTIDTGLLLAGMLMASSYFKKNNKIEKEIRQRVDQFYRRIEWDWMLNGGDTLAMAWSPGEGFSPSRCQGYNEALMLYLFGLASPTHPLKPRNYEAWVTTYEWLNPYGIEHLYAGPLFIHHFSHAWVDFRDIRDDFMRRKKSDYFKNSRKAVLVHQKYAIENQWGFKGYGENCWGLSAGDGPVNKRVTVRKKRKRTFGYAARGAPYQPDDGTLMPAAVLASLPFAPKEARNAICHIKHHYPHAIRNYHIPGGFNPSIKTKDEGIWISDAYYGLDQGIIVLMIENYRAQTVWKIMRKNAYLHKGLKKAGFKGGWLGPSKK